MAKAAPSVIRLKTDDQHQDVLLNIWWQETDRFSLFPLVSDEFVLYDMLKLLPRSQFKGSATFNAVKEWFAKELDLDPDMDDQFALTYSMPAMLFNALKTTGDSKRDVFSGTLQVQISMEPEETDIDISFFTPGAFQKSLTRVHEIPNSVLGLTDGPDGLYMDLCIDTHRPLVF